jgi:hypothetical protein
MSVILRERLEIDKHHIDIKFFSLTSDRCPIRLPGIEHFSDHIKNVLESVS